MKGIIKRMGLAILVIGMVGLAVTACNTGGGTAAGSKVTVSLSNAAAVNDHYLYAYLYAENETDVNNPAALLATNSAQIAGGSACFVLKADDGSWMPTATDWTGTEGLKYDVYIFTDSNGDADPVPGSDKATDPYPQTVTINGDQTIEVDYTTMVDYPL